MRGYPVKFQDGGRNIGLLSAAAEDLGPLILGEFALIYGNDWFQFPLVVPIGSQVWITSLSVADTFGITTPIPHYSTVDGGLGKVAHLLHFAGSSGAGGSLDIGPAASPVAAHPGCSRTSGQLGNRRCLTAPR